MNDAARTADDFNDDTDEPTHVSVRPENKPRANDSERILTAEFVDDTDAPLIPAGVNSNSLTKSKRRTETIVSPAPIDTERLATRNRALARYVLVPLLLMTVALLGGLRVGAADRSFIFLPPPLVTLLMALLLVLLLVRGQAVNLRAWFASHLTLPALMAHAVTFIALFFASAQAFNAVLPESGLLHWLFVFCFLWTLWQNQFAGFDARRLLKSLVVLFGTAFLLKYALLNNLNAGAGQEQTWKQKLVSLFLEGVSLGTLDLPNFAPATGYIAFFTLTIYLLALIVLVATVSDQTA